MASISRRKFLEESMIATAVAAAAAAPAVETVVAQDAAPKSANDTLQHAIIGCRIRGRVHAREFAGKWGVQVSYVCDPDRQLADELAAAVEKQQGHRPQAVQDLRRVFDDKAVDTVSIAAPNHWHALASIWAMQAGKDVYVEKPVSHNVSEGRRMVQVARKSGRICQGGTQNRSRGALAEAAAYIREGKLGDVTLARSIIYGRRGSIGSREEHEPPAHVDYNLFLGPAPLAKLTRPELHYDWHWIWDTGNGELGNNNIHMVDMCRWLMGLSGLGDAVTSIGGRLGYEDAGETPNTQIVLHTFGNKAIVQEVRGLKTDPFSKKFSAGSIVHGTQGFIAESSLFDPDGNLVRTFLQGKNENHFQNFISAVRSRRRDDLNAEIAEGHQSSALCHVGNISYRLGRTESVDGIAGELKSRKLNEDASRTFARMVDHLHENQIDLNRTPLTIGPTLQIDGEQFINNPAANELLTRPYRPPFIVPTENQV